MPSPLYPWLVCFLYHFPYQKRLYISVGRAGRCSTSCCMHPPAQVIIWDKTEHNQPTLLLSIVLGVVAPVAHVHKASKCFYSAPNSCKGVQRSTGTAQPVWWPKALQPLSGRVLHLPEEKALSSFYIRCFKHVKAAYVRCNDDLRYVFCLSLWETQAKWWMKQLPEKDLAPQCYSLGQRRMGPINQIFYGHFPASSGSEMQLREGWADGLMNQWPNSQTEWAKLISAISEVLQKEICFFPLPCNCGANGKSLCPHETSGLTCSRTSSWD